MTPAAWLLAQSASSSTLNLSRLSRSPCPEVFTRLPFSQHPSPCSRFRALACDGGWEHNNDQERPKWSCPPEHSSSWEFLSLPSPVFSSSSCQGKIKQDQSAEREVRRWRVFQLVRAGTQRRLLGGVTSEL